MISISRNSLMQLFFIVLLLAFADADRFWMRGAWGDEERSIKIATTKSIAEIPQANLPQMQPPLYEFIIHFLSNSSKLEQNILLARSISIGFSILSLAFIILFMKELEMNTRVFLAIAFILNNFMFYSTTEGRLYAMAAFFTLLSIVFYIRTIASERSSYSTTLVFGVSTLAMLYTATATMSVFIGQVIFTVLIILIPLKPNKIRERFGAYKLSVLSLLLISLSYWYFALVAISFGQRVYIKEAVELSSYVNSVIHNLYYVLFSQIMLLHNSIAPYILVPFFLAGVLYGMKKNARVCAYLLTLIVIEMLILSYVNVHRRVTCRYLIGSFIGYTMFAALGYEYITNYISRHRKHITSILMGLLLFYYGAEFAIGFNVAYPDLFKFYIDKHSCKNQNNIYLTPTSEKLDGNYSTYQIDGFGEEQFHDLFTASNKDSSCVSIMSRVHVPYDLMPGWAVKYADTLLPAYKKEKYFFESMDVRLSRHDPYAGFVYFYSPVAGGVGKSSNISLDSNPEVAGIGMNAPIMMELAREPRQWFDFLSSSMKGNRFLRHYGAIICAEGSVGLPHFASVDRDVFARVSYKYLPEDGEKAPGEPILLADVNGDRKKFHLFTNQKSSFTFPLGPGQGNYGIKNLHLSLEEGRRDVVTISEASCFTLPEILVWSLPNVINGPVYLPADLNHEHFFRKGFYPPSRSGESVFRWSLPQSHIYLPKQSDGNFEPSLTLRAIELRPYAQRHRPRFLFNGREAAVSVVGQKGNVVDFIFQEVNWLQNEENRLDMMVEPFNPTKATGSLDNRDLGIAVLGIEITGH